MIVEKNNHLEAAISLLKSKSSGQQLLATLKEKPCDQYTFFAKNSGDVDVAVLCVINAGASATIIASEPTDEHASRGIVSLIEESVQSLKSAPVSIAQTVLPVDGDLIAHAFTHAGFSKLAILTYMEHRRSSVGGTEADHVHFVSMEHRSDEMLATILEETYVGSLDCPAIHGIRACHDIIDGHRSHAPYNPALWTVAEYERKPAGVVLLNAISETSCMELAYLGVSPWARRRGIGDALLHHAIEQTKSLELPRITLAVDEANIPAICLYKKWNFQETRQRLAMIRKLY